jgi:hypothetical protein
MVSFSFFHLFTGILSFLALVSAQRPLNLTHTGGCDPVAGTIDPTSCTLPVDANITLIPQSRSSGDSVGVGVKVDANVSIDLYARSRGSPPNLNYIPAIQFQENVVGTLIRVIFPVGFLLCPTVVMLQGNTMVLGAESATTGMRLGPWPNTSFRQVLPSPKGSGLKEPPFASPIRAGTLGNQGPTDPPNFQTRTFEINITSNATETTRIPNITQRLTFVISNVLTSQTVGNIPPPESLLWQFAIQIFQISKVQIQSPQTTRMIFYNNRINDNRLDLSRYPWFRSTFLGPSVLSTNFLCPSCAQASLNPTKMGSTSTANISVTNVSPIPGGAVLRIVFPSAFSLGSVPLNQISVSAINTIIDGNAWGPINASRQGSSIVLSRAPTLSPVYSGSTIVVLIPQVLLPLPPVASVLSVFQASVSTGNMSGNITYDTGSVVLPPLSPYDMQGVLITLSSYLVGNYPVYVNVSFIVTQQIDAGGVVSIRVPTDDFSFLSVDSIFKVDSIFTKVETEVISSGYLELRYYANSTLTPQPITLSLGPVRNRGYAGPSSLPFLIATRTGLNNLEFAAENISQPFKPNNLAFLNVFLVPSPSPSAFVNFSFQMKVTNPVPSGGMMSVLLPREFSFSAASKLFVSFGSVFQQVANQSIVLSVSAAPAQTSVLVVFDSSWVMNAIDSFVSLNITQVQCPSYVLNGGYTNVSTFYSMTSSAQIDGSSTSVSMTPNELQVNSLTLTPPQAGASGSVVVNFLLSEDLPLDGKLVFIFPEKYVVSQASLTSGTANLPDCCNVSNILSNSNFLVPNILVQVDGLQIQLQLFFSSHFSNRALNSTSQAVLYNCQPNNLSTCLAVCSTYNYGCLSGIAQDTVGYLPLFHASKSHTVGLAGIQFPAHGGYTGELQFFSSTSNNNKIAAAQPRFQDLQPGSLDDLMMVFDNTVVGQSGSVALSFRTKTAIHSNASIAITLPFGFVCSGDFSLSITPNNSISGSTSSNSAGKCDRTNVVEYVLDGVQVLAADSLVVLNLSNVRNSYFSGVRESVKIQTRFSPSAGNQYIVDSGMIDAPSLNASVLSDVSVQISSLSGGPPQAGQEVLMSVRLRADRPVPLSNNGRIVLLLGGTGVELPPDQDVVKVEFSCPSLMRLSQFCANSTNNLELGVILPCPKCYFPDALCL